ncbi:MAG: Spy/CpxP family protein refolding chaperone [Desulfosalsimonadaceae bacterium]|nr:Spy/CpxP family protein refolding chaperone [Desulfosalsimonadaceae bacterium]
MKKKLIMRTVLVLALIMGIGNLSWAQQGKCPMAKDGKCQMAKECHYMGMGGGMMMFKELNLSDRQQEQVKAVMDRHQNEMQGLDAKIDAARKSVHEAVHADVFNEQRIRDAHKTLAAEKENMAVLRGKIFSEIRPILTPEQVTQLKEMRNRHAGKMADRPKCPAMSEE